MTGGLGSCSCAGCSTPECNRRVSAIKSWNGWLPWDANPTTSLYTTKYRTLTVEVSLTTGAAFDGDNDWIQIDSTYTPQAGDVVYVGLSGDCIDGTVNAYNDSGGNPRNYQYCQGGTWKRTYVCSLKRLEQGTPACTYSWPRLYAPSPNYAKTYAAPSEITITDEGFATPVVVQDDRHPGTCCDDYSSTIASDWETKPLPSPPAPYDTVPCNNKIKFVLDTFVAGTGYGGDDGSLVSRVVSGTNGEIMTLTYFNDSYAADINATIVATLSDPYTLAEAMSDAEDLLGKISLSADPVVRKQCNFTDYTTGCGMGESADTTVQEDHACSGGSSQPYVVGPQADAFDPDLGATTRAQRMWYETEPGFLTGHIAWIALVKSAFDCGAGTNIGTIPYTKPNNRTNTAGTTTFESKAGMQTFPPPTYPTLAVLYNA